MLLTLLRRLGKTLSSVAVGLTDYVSEQIISDVVSNDSGVRVGVRVGVRIGIQFQIIDVNFIVTVSMNCRRTRPLDVTGTKAFKFTIAVACVAINARSFAAAMTEKLRQYARQKQRRTLAKLAIFCELLFGNQCGRYETKAHASIYRSPSGDFRWHVRGLGYRVVNRMYGYIRTKVTAGRRFRTDLSVRKSEGVKPTVRLNFFLVRPLSWATTRLERPFL